MTDIKSLSLPELTAEFARLGQPEYRAKQVFAWLSKGAGEYSQMTNIPLSLRSVMETEFSLGTPKMAARQDSADGTVKLLWQLSDGQFIESVVMRYEHGNTVCVSSQVGCRMGCKFCASTLGGLVRNLTAGEILDQVIFSGIETGRKISNVVLMGIGEPLDNMQNVLRFVELCTAKEGLGLGARHISLSTCGLAENIDILAGYELQLTLSISLHAPDDATRSELMPINAKYNVARLMRSCREYFETTGRRISSEYALIDGVNDTEKHAKLLCGLLTRLPDGTRDQTPWHVNLILLNEVPERGLSASNSKNANAFAEILTKNGINCTFRRRLGRDIEAACGQLRRRAVSNQLA